MMPAASLAAVCYILLLMISTLCKAQVILFSKMKKCYGANSLPVFAYAVLAKA